MERFFDKLSDVLDIICPILFPISAVVKCIKYRKILNRCEKGFAAPEVGIEFFQQQDTIERLRIRVEELKDKNEHLIQEWKDLRDENRFLRKML